MSKKSMGNPQNCHFVEISNSNNEREWKRFRCKRCLLVTNHTPSPAHKIFCKCSKPNRFYAMIAKGLHYYRALRYWNKSGRPKRGKQEIERIFNEICVPCEHFNEERSSCYKCGCKVSAKNNPLINMIAMATKHCPLEKW